MHFKCSNKYLPMAKIMTKSADDDAFLFEAVVIRKTKIVSLSFQNFQHFHAEISSSDAMFGAIVRCIFEHD